MKKGVKILLVCILILIITILASLFIYSNQLKPVKKSDTSVYFFNIEEGTAASTVITNLKEEKLIKSELITKVYAKLHNISLKAGRYELSKSLSTKEILDKIEKGDSLRNTVSVTFIEGKRIVDIADTISKNFPYTKEEVLNIVDNKEYVKSLIEKYDFLTNDILNEKIYHPLEGYLAPDTYEFYKEASIKDIIEKMLNNMESRLKKYELNSKYSIHEILTLASIIESEGASSSDRKGVAGVFYNRLKDNWTLGSDVTTYYGVNKSFSDGDLYVSELTACNGYNTSIRSTCAFTGLPVGPISNFSIESLDACINPTTSDYYYFVADKNGKTYFTKTESEHIEITNKLKSTNMWYEY